MKRQSFVNNLFLPMLIVALVAGCGDKKDGATTGGAPPAQVAAKVNGTELTVSQVDFALQRNPNLDKAQMKTASLQVVRFLVEQEVLAQKALGDKLDSDPKVMQALDAARRQILAEAFLARKLGTPAEPSDAEKEWNTKWRDRTVLFGDAGGAVVVEKRETGVHGQNHDGAEENEQDINALL